MHVRTKLILGVVVLALGITACKKTPAQGRATGGGAAAFAVQVVAVPARQQAITESITLIGSITANEMIEVKSETDGTVEKIDFLEGQRIEKGQLLVALDDTKLKATLAEAEANFQLSKSSYARGQQLLQDKLISQQEFDQASATFAMGEATVEKRRRELRDTRIYAPFSGIAGSRQISPGQVISRNTTLTWLVDLDIVKLEVKVPERFLSQVHENAPIDFNVAAFPGEVYRGEVYFISPQLEEATRTALVKARVPNKTGKLRSGMFASLDLNLEHRAQSLVIPEPAIMSNGDAMMVFAVDASTNAVIKAVKIGLRLAGKAEVLHGLVPGEMVVVEGVQKVRPGGPVRLAPAEMSAPYL